MGILAILTMEKLIYRFAFGHINGLTIIFMQLIIIWWRIEGR
jgi:hypothetical protein